MIALDEARKCCGTTCDRPALVEALERPMFCVIEWTASAGVVWVVGPLPQFDAKIRAREMAKIQEETNGDEVYTYRSKSGAYNFHDGVGGPLLSSLTVAEVNRAE